jgi:lipopolysaccharide export LptBFGC system permease protein LptF
MLKEAEDMTLIGPVIKEQQKIINDTIEKKLSLSKLQSSIWEKSQNSNKESDFLLTDVDDSILQGLIQKDLNKDSSKDNYRL